jgi:oxepin-CoA hydrolase/3-oxo-5,6-dehydrosuberyl-CoA semialdehyde dehydrogenase
VKTGGPPLRKMTFPERGRMLKALAMYLMDRKEEFYQISYKTGATKADSWVDIEGGIGNVFANASLRKQLGNMPFYVDGPPVLTSRAAPSWATTSWFRRKVWPYTSTPSTSPSGACWRSAP